MVWRKSRAPARKPPVPAATVPRKVNELFTGVGGRQLAAGLTARSGMTVLVPAAGETWGDFSRCHRSPEHQIAPFGQSGSRRTNRTGGVIARCSGQERRFLGTLCQPQMVPSLICRQPRQLESERPVPVCADVTTGLINPGFGVRGIAPS